MKIKTILITGAALFISFFANAQTSPTPEHKQLAAKRASLPIKIDGKLDETSWKDAAKPTGFTELRPVPGRKEFEASRTDIYLLYDDGGIYVGGYCHEKSKDSISTELNGRDGFGNNDWVGVVFDTYDDKINGFEYFVTPLGEQMDSKVSNSGNEDFSWNAVWKSAAVIHEDGWSFEMFIPLSAIRFSKKNIQNWGLNIMRRRQKIGQQVFWNTLDPNINGFLTQNGMWNGLENIKPPLRLQFSPYFSTYVNHFPHNTAGKKNWTSSVNGGMDVKYGLSQAFTLDMTLIPDFGQVQSDNIVVNLTPFEQKYTENRPFFNEGTELFSKGNLFYARRIGIEPILTHSAGEYMKTNEIISESPRESKLINATKVSGRTQKGLGIGFLNAVTKPRYFILQDTITKGDRKVLIDPLTNYSVIVLDQTLKNNSSISLVNTNVWRSGSEYDANVTAALFSFNDKKNMWNVNGKVANSRLIGFLPDGKTLSGYSHSLGLGKTSGRFNFQLGQDLTDTKFNPRDLGFFQFGNTLDHYAWIGYRWTKPTKWYNNIYFNLNAFYSRQLKPSEYRSANFNVNANGQMKNLWYVGALFGFEPKYNDFFEAHKDGYVFPGWSDWFVDGWFETNNAKKYKLYAELMYVKRSLLKSERYNFNMGNRYRFSDKLSVNHNINIAPQYRNMGFAGFYNNEPLMGVRDIRNIENSVNIKYSFNAKMSVNVRVRHYWFEVDNYDFYVLKQDRSLVRVSNIPDEYDQNVNLFNLDAVYTWEFAPGSFINIVWKNAADEIRYFYKDGYSSAAAVGYGKNFNNTMQADDNNNLSLKIIYFLDYLQLKKGKKKNPK